MFRLNERTRPWWTLLGACGGLFVLMLDSTALGLALPDLQRDLNASAEALQWVQNAYLLSMAVLVVTLSRLGDIYGRRRIYLLGTFVFGAGAILCALAWGPAVLVAGRVIQGAGGAAMLGLSLALASNAFSDADRPRALGIWTTISAIALAVGPLVGGLLIASVSWRAIFWLCVPVCVVGFAITAWAAPESRDESAGTELDWPGLAALSIGLTAVVLALVQGKGWGWGSAATLGTFVGGVAMLAVFWVVEHRVRHPIMEFPLFRNRPYLGATAAAFALVGAYWGVMFFQPQYLQNILGYSVIVAGLLVLPITVPMVLFSQASTKVIERVGVRITMTAGMVCGAAGTLWLTQIGPGTTYAGGLLPGYLLFGISLALVYTPMSTAAMAAMPREKAGIAAGVLGMNRLMAGALVLALMGAVFLHIQTDDVTQALEQRAGPATAIEKRDIDALLAGSPEAKAAVAALPPAPRAAVNVAAGDAFTDALSSSMWIVVVLVVVCAGLTWWLLAPAKPPPAVRAAVAPEDLHHHHGHSRLHL